MKVAAVVLAVTVALVVQTTLAHVLARAAAVIDLVLVVVVWVGLTSGPSAGLLTGAFGGLIQDALSTGVIGVGSLAKTLVGFVAGVLGTQFVVAHALPRFVVFFASTVLQVAILAGLYALLDLRQVRPGYAVVAGRALGNAAVGVIAFQVVEFVPGAAARRRLRRR